MGMLFRDGLNEEAKLVGSSMSLYICIEGTLYHWSTIVQSNTLLLVLIQCHTMYNTYHIVVLYSGGVQEPRLQQLCLEFPHLCLGNTTTTARPRLWGGGSKRETQREQKYMNDALLLPQDCAFEESTQY